MTNGYVINITAVDRPGIVAGVSSAIAKLNGNLESCSQTVLDGYFTLIMTFTLPERKDPESLKSAILQEPLLEGCQAILFPADKIETPTNESDSNIYVITAFGKDCQGIISLFTRYLSDKEINIVDLYGKITPEGEFVLIGQVEVNPNLDLQNLQYDLEEMGDQVGFTVRIQHNNVFVATNQIRIEH